MVDVFYVPYMLKLSELYYKEIFEGREELKSWWERVKERPSVRSLVANGIELAAFGCLNQIGRAHV